MEGQQQSNIFKSYSLEISILVAALLISSTVFVSFGSLSASNQALAAKLSAGPLTGAVVAPSPQLQPQQQVPSAPPVGQPIVINTAGKSIRGDVNAKVTIVEFSDFQCPFCKRANPTVEQVMKDYAGQVKLIYMHYPLSFHEYAQKAAEGFECANDQGKAWEFHDKIFNGDNSNIPATVLKQYAIDLGMDSAKFDQCLDNGEKASAVKADVNQLDAKSGEFAAWGIDGLGTPTFLVNGKPLVGAQPYAAFKAAIDQALAS